MAYLITISFILHFFTFFIIIILIQKLNLKSQIGVANEQEKLKSEIEDLLVAYTIEMKEENEKLVNKIILNRKAREQEQFNSLNTSKNEIRERDSKIESLTPLYKQTTKHDIEEEPEFMPPITTGNEDIVERSATA